MKHTALPFAIMHMNKEWCQSLPPHSTVRMLA